MKFQTERWADLAKEIEPLLWRNWRDTALDHEASPLDPDYARYENLDKIGKLHITTAREAGELVGYFILVVNEHPHYQTTLFGFMDVFFMDHKFRNGPAGIRLFLEMEKALKDRGVREVIANTKIHRDVSNIFERLGWRHTAATYTKLIA